MLRVLVWSRARLDGLLMERRLRFANDVTSRVPRAKTLD